jgi:tetratricopeptide (TPR) repeat protein
VYLKQRGKKYEIVSNIPVLSVSEVKGRVEVLLDNHPVNDASLIVLKFWNGGDVPVRSEDFDGNNPIKLTFKEDLQGKGTAFRYLQRFQEALNAYEQALYLNPNYKIAHNNRANTLEKLDQQKSIQ